MTLRHLARITASGTRQFFSPIPACAAGCAFAGALLVVVGVGCGSGGSSRPGEIRSTRDEQRSFREEAGEVFADVGGVRPNPRSGAPADASAPTWGVLIAQFSADAAGQASARAALPRVRSQGGLPGAFLEERGESIALIVGRHGTIEQARRELAHVRNLELRSDGTPVKPYQGAILAPPWADESAGSMPEFDLRNAKAQYGKDALYTLQVGIYGRIDRTRPDPDELMEYRQAAEQAVAQLRADGEEAFYYHGPTSSIVSVGIFDEEDHDPSTGVRGESPRLRAARESHPHNLLNGKGIMETRRNASGRPVESLQRSALVAIPG